MRPEGVVALTLREEVIERIEKRLGNLSSSQLLEIEEALERFQPTPISLESLRAQREAILEIAARYGARQVRLFGSVARGEAGRESHIDFLVDLEPGQSLLDLMGLKFDLEELLGRKVDAVTENALKPEIRARVLADAIAL